MDTSAHSKTLKNSKEFRGYKMSIGCPLEEQYVYKAKDWMRHDSFLSKNCENVNLNHNLAIVTNIIISVILLEIFPIFAVTTNVVSPTVLMTQERKSLTYAT